MTWWKWHPTANRLSAGLWTMASIGMNKPKKNQAQKVHQRSTQLKEVKFRPYTGDHDMEVKFRNVRKFLGEGNKVKITVMFRGREMVYQQVSGRNMLAKIAKLNMEFGVVDQHPSKEGRAMVMVLSPKPIKK